MLNTISARSPAASPPPATSPPPVTSPPAASSPPAARPYVGHVVGLALLLGVALVLRVYGAWAFPFEQDELYTVTEATALWDSPLHPGIEARPLYYLMQHVIFAVLPASTFSLRLLPLLFGMVGVWVTWLAARRIFGVEAAYVAAVLVTISPWHLHASGMGRYWSLIYLLAATALLLLVRGYESQQPRHLVGACVALLLGAATHPTFTFAFVGVAFGLSLVGNGGRIGWRWPSRRVWTYLWGPYLVALALGYALISSSREASMPTWDGRGLVASLRLLPAVVDWVTPVLFAAGLLAAVIVMRYGADEEQRSLGSAALFGTISALAALLILSFRASVYADYALPVLPFLIVAVGGLVHLGTRRMRSPAAVLPIVATLVIAAAMFPSVVSHLSTGTRFDYRPAFETIRRVDPDVPVLAWPITIQHWYAPELRSFELRRDRAYLDEVLVREGEAWAVISVQRYGIVADGEGQVEGWVRERCRFHSAHEQPRLDYRRYRVELYRCGTDAPAAGSG